jgi:hypothetical protein
VLYTGHLLGPPYTRTAFAASSSQACWVVSQGKVVTSQLHCVWPAGNTLKTARAKKAEYEHHNALKEDFDKDEAKVADITGHVFTWEGKPMAEGWKTAFQTAWRNAKLTDLHFHDLRHTFVTRKVREGWDYKRITAITGDKTFAVFQRYNNPSEEDVKNLVLADPPKKVVG